MVKNTKGGNKSKKIGRKFINTPINTQIRLADPNEPLEIYGVVIKLFGHGRFQIKDTTGKLRLVVIPNKFRGRGKRDNTVTLGGWVLVGIREYESSDDPKCDLLEVYNEVEKEKLKNSGDPIFLELKSEYDKDNNLIEEEDLFTFNEDVNDKYEEIIENTKTETKTIHFDDQDINIDDI